MKNLGSRRREVEQEYAVLYQSVLLPLASKLQSHITAVLEGQPRIDRVVARPKSIERFLKKAFKTDEGNAPKYSDPINQIQDQLGARIIVFYPCDVVRVSKIVERYFRPIEAQSVVPESEWEFGYFGTHYVLVMPTDLVVQRGDTPSSPDFFELQIKTLFQHAWSEAEHDLGYKPELGPMAKGDKRLLALASAEAWSADRIFDGLFLSRI